MMKQITLEKFGKPDLVAKCVEAPEPGEPSAWEVVVKILAFPINAADLATLAGVYGTLPSLPSVIGMEAVGTVVSIGSSVTRVSVGQTVVMIGNNNWCQFRKVPEALVHPIPEGSDLLQMSLLKVNPITALMMLRADGLTRPGDWVIQNAPLSSVGQCVLQLAKELQLRTINVVRREEAKAEVKQLGGDISIEDGPDLARRLKDLIGMTPIKLGLDAVAGASTGQLADCLSEGGQIVNYGMLSNESCVVSPQRTIFNGLRLQGFWLTKSLPRLNAQSRHELFDYVAARIANQTLKVRIDSCFPIEEIAAAILRADSPERDGKVIIIADKALQAELCND